jgi:hypothetical protein
MPVAGQEMIVENVHNHTGIVAVFGPEAVFALQHNRMGIRKCINITVEFDAGCNLPSVSGGQIPAPDKISNEITDHDFRVIGRKEKMGQKVHFQRYTDKNSCAQEKI